MNRIILSTVDYKRIHDSINNAVRANSINEQEALTLSRELEKAEIIEPENMPGDVVTMNSTVKVTFAKTGKQLELKIVYPKEADVSRNLISIFSPIAAALIGYRVGDTIDWTVPSGPTTIRIDEITYQPEASGEFAV